MMLRLAETTQATAGPKAAILGHLAAAGFPVPPGFVMPVNTYRAFTDHLNLTQVLADQGSAEVWRLIETQPFPPQLLRDLTNALTDLGDFPVAVRSSATTEDNPDASAAGQHDTYLGIQGANAVADRVRACWSSLWSDRATTYRHTHHQPHANANTRANAATHVGTSTDTDTGTHIGLDTAAGAQSGFGTDAGAQSGIGAGLGTETGAQAGCGTGAQARTGAGFGIESGAQVGTDAGLGSDGGAQAGTGAGLGMDTGAQVGTGGGADVGADAPTGTGTGAQARTGAGLGTDAGAQVGTGRGADIGTGAQAGTGTGAQVGTDAGLGADTGAQVGTGGGADTDAGVQAGTGAGIDGDAQAGTGEPGIAVIVQRHIDAEVAGVLFASEGRSIIEASWGLGESVVQGLVTPDAFTIGSDGRTEHRLGSKQTRIDRTSAGTTVTTQVPDRDRERRCLTDQQLAQLHQLGQAVITYLGAPQDIEFALDSTGLWLLQSRPITAGLPPDDDVLSDRGESALPPIDNDVRVGRGEVAARATREAAGITAEVVLRASTAPGMTGEVGAASGVSGEVGAASGVAGEVVLQGVGGSAGTASGVARVVEGPGDFGRVGVGEILVCRFTDPAWTPLFGVVAGVVTETGGRLSHAAIVAREHRIPAVLGVPDVMATVMDGEQLTIVGGAGTVRLLRS